MGRQVLVCTVGGSPEPVVHAVVQNRPLDFVYFVCSTGGEPGASSDRTICEETTQTQRGECPHCNKKFSADRRSRPIVELTGLTADTFAIVRVRDPDSLEQVFAVCDGIDAEIETRFAAARVIANYTGGTKTMSLGLGAYALRTAGRWELQFNVKVAGRTDLVRIGSGDIALPQETAELLARDAETKAGHLLERHDPEGAVETLSFVLTRTPLVATTRHRLAKLHARAEMLAAWDRFDHARALAIARTHDELRDENEAALRRLIRGGELFAANTPWHASDVSGLELVDDLLRNARSCADRSRFDDAVGRLYRATELLAQIQLRRGYGIRTGDVDLSNAAIPESARTWLADYHVRDGERTAIGLFAAWQLLVAVNDPAGLWFAKHGAPLHRFIEARNQSLFAHGIRPIDSDIWHRIGPAWLEWIGGAVTHSGER